MDGHPPRFFSFDFLDPAAYEALHFFRRNTIISIATACGVLAFAILLLDEYGTVNPFEIVKSYLRNKDTMAGMTGPEKSQEEFAGSVKVSQKPPSKANLDKVAERTVLDKDGNKRSFKSLYEDKENPDSRTLIIFIRHFFCGVCSSLASKSSPLPPFLQTNLPLFRPNSSAPIR